MCVCVQVTVRPGGLHPLEACKAWHLRTYEKMTWKMVAASVLTVSGDRPTESAVRRAVARVSDDSREDVPRRVVPR